MTVNLEQRHILNLRSLLNYTGERGWGGGMHPFQMVLHPLVLKPSDDPRMKLHDFTKLLAEDAPENLFLSVGYFAFNRKNLRK